MRRRKIGSVMYLHLRRNSGVDDAQIGPDKCSSCKMLGCDDLAKITFVTSAGRVVAI